MFWKKKVLKKVVVYFNNHEGQKFSEKITIPNGWKFKQGIGWDKLVDEQGDTQSVFDWRAGYTIEYEFVY